MGARYPCTGNDEIIQRTEEQSDSSKPAWFIQLYRGSSFRRCVQKSNPPPRRLVQSRFYPQKVRAKSIFLQKGACKVEFPPRRVRVKTCFFLHSFRGHQRACKFAHFWFKSPEPNNACPGRRARTCGALLRFHYCRA